MKRAVVTGCTGAVGTALIEELAAQDYDVIAVPREHSNRAGAIPVMSGVRVVACNMEDYAELPAKIGESCDAFFHLAWGGTYGASRDDVVAQNENVLYTLQAVKAARKLGCKVFLGAGSQSEFGHVEGVLSPELMCKPVTAYGAAKLSACNLSRVLCRQLGIRHAWCRILSVYGPHDGEYTMVMSIIRELLEGKTPACTKGDQIWDYIYSKDAAKAFRLAAEQGRADAVYCLGSGETKRLRDYISIIRDHIDPDLSIGFGERPYYPNQVMHLEADIRGLQEDTGYTAEYSFEQGIDETIQWVKGKRNQQ